MTAFNSCRYDIELLRRLWAAGESCVGIAAALGCSPHYVSALRQRYGLPVRRVQKLEWRCGDDPTPEEIAERAAECRARRQEKTPPPRGQCDVGMRCYSWRGDRFEAIA